MLRTVVVSLLAVPALALPAAAYAASPTTLSASVGTHGPNGTKISLVEGSHSRGGLTITQCANTSPTAFVCKGTGTVFDLGPAKVKIRWKCPVDKSCAKSAEGTLKNHGSLLGLLHVKASVQTFQTRGSQFGIVWEPTGE
jgi:hypothetical protein